MLGRCSDKGGHGLSEATHKDATGHREPLNNFYGNDMMEMVSQLQVILFQT